MLLCCSAEMFLSLLGALKELADGNTEELGEQFSSALLEATDSARTKLHAMQAESPNTFKAAHTLLAFRHAVAEFYHKLHTYQDQGFFDAKLVEELSADRRNIVRTSWANRWNIVHKLMENH